MSDKDEDLLKELNQFLPPDAQQGSGNPSQESVTYEIDLGQFTELARRLVSLPPGTTFDSTESNPAVQEVALDDQALDLARDAARPAWYESGWTGLVAIGGPLLVILSGYFGGAGILIILGFLPFLLFGSLSCFGLVLFVLWLIYFFSYRSRVAGLRTAIRNRRGWAVTGPVHTAGDTTVVADGMILDAARPVSLPDLAATANCAVLFIRSSQNRGLLIGIKGPDGRLLYPPQGVVPTIMKWSAVAASLLVSFGLTAACNAQANVYGDAATHLREIDAAVPCTGREAPGAACWRWTNGTVMFDAAAPSTDFNFFGAGISTCRVTLRWANSSQQGDIRGEGTDCSFNLKRDVLTPARIKLVRDYAVEADVAGTSYRTDRWPPFGDSALGLATLFRLVSIAWVAWPVVHVVAAVLYRVRRKPSTGAPRTMEAQPEGTP